MGSLFMREPVFMACFMKIMTAVVGLLPGSSCLPGANLLGFLKIKITRSKLGKNRSKSAISIIALTAKTILWGMGV